jgi:hypothetical protein
MQLLLQQSTNQLIHICTARSTSINYAKSTGGTVSNCIFSLFITGKGFGTVSLFTCCADIHKAWLYKAEDHAELLLIRHLNPAVLICAVAPEFVCQHL